MDPVEGADAAARVGVFHLGLQHAWQTALAFQTSGRLGWFATTIFHDPERWPYKAERMLPAGLGKKLAPELRRRSSPLIDRRNLRLFGATEWAEVFLRRAGIVRGGRGLLGPSRRYFSGKVIRLLQREPVDVAWGYNGFCRDVFRWAKPRGVRCVLDQTIGHYRAQNEMLARERERCPDFFREGDDRYPEEFIEYQEEELELADVVVAGSEFVRRTLADRGVDARKVRVLPYGFEETEFERPSVRRVEARAPRFLFVGQIHPRKGVHHLLEAFAGIPRSEAELELIGTVGIPEPTLARYASRVEVRKHVPRFQMPSVMASGDCFVFPSLFEGSALVLYEAIGSGLGRIYSEMSGHGEPEDDGVRLSHVSADSVREAVLRVCREPDLVERWSRSAIGRRRRFTWDAYRENARRLVTETTS